MVQPHHADGGASLRIVLEAAEQANRLLGACQLCENPSVSVINE